MTKPIKMTIMTPSDPRFKDLKDKGKIVFGNPDTDQPRTSTNTRQWDYWTPEGDDEDDK